MRTPKLTPLRKASLLATLIATIVAGGYSALTWAQTYHSQFANKDQVTVQFTQTKISILEISIRNYEDKLFDIELLVAQDEASPFNLAKKQQINRRLSELLHEVALLRNLVN